MLQRFKLMLYPFSVLVHGVISGRQSMLAGFAFSNTILSRCYFLVLKTIYSHLKCINFFVFMP